MLASVTKTTAETRSRGQDGVQFRMPNPGDVFMLIAFAWATFCFLMVVGGDRIARQAAMLSRSRFVRDLVLTDQSGIALLMIGGIAGLGVAFFLIHRYRNASIAALIVSITFASATWPLAHDVGFAVKYLLIVYLAVFSFVFFIRNGWRMLEMKGYRLMLIYLGWIALVVAVDGFRINDVWYFGTEFVLMIGFGAGWMAVIQDREALKRLNYLVAYAGVFCTVVHLLSIVVMPQFTMNGRFVSVFERATGFAAIYATAVVAMFWLSMYEPRQTRARIFTFFAFVGLGLILWSGARNATVASLLGVAGIWWVMRSQLLVYVLFIAIVGLIGQLVLTGNEEAAMIGNRFKSTDSERFEIWALYLDLFFKSPVFGYGYEGLTPAVYGEKLADALGSFVRLQIPHVHNHYLAFAVRFGAIGLVLTTAIFFVAIKCSFKVIFNPRIDLEDKKQFVLPAALVAVVAAEGLFEDTMGSTGRGTLHNVIYAMAIPLVYVYGNKLLAEADDKSSIKRHSHSYAPVQGAPQIKGSL